MGVGCVTLVAACSSNASTAHQRKLPSEWSASWEESAKSSGGHRIYRYRGEGASKTDPVFLAFVDECPIPKHVTPSATTRQLLVGLEKISRVSEEPLEIPDARALRTTLTAELDGVPLKLSSITVRRKDCVLDYVMWSRDAADAVSVLERAGLEVSTALGASHGEHPGD